MEQFADPYKIAALLAAFERPWYICGGWAIDLFLNRPTRAHKDVDVALARNDQLAAQRYFMQRGWSLEVAEDGQLLLWGAGEWLALPAHVIWCRHASHDPNFCELLFNEIDEREFRFRRDQGITLPRERLGLTSACGLPILAPEIVLLYKSKNSDHGGNNADFRQALPLLEDERRAWLRAALERMQPEHPWLNEL
jgi:hypothetical protein